MAPIDVLVIGAGPAGATAARSLAVGGARVRLVDRARFPRNKPCGGAVSIRALDRFPYLREALDRIPTRFVSRLHLQSPAGEAAKLASPLPAALMIRRVDFDALLVQLARDAGADVLEGVEITQAVRTPDAIVLTTRNGRRLTAPLVIAADGAGSVVARRLGMNPGWSRSALALDMMEETPFESLSCGDPDEMWVAYGYGHAHGYAYVFPKRRHVNVGMGYVLDHYRRAVGEAPYSLQRHLVDSLCDTRVLAGISRREHFTPALIPVAGPLRRTGDDRVMLAGDAGGFVNAFSAEGIYYAMVSGDLAARAVLSGDARRFERAWRAEIGTELRDSVRAQRFLFADMSRIDAMVRGAGRHPRLARTLIDYLSGRTTYAFARARFIAQCPLTALRMLSQH